MVFEDFLNKVRTLASSVGADFTASIDEDKGRYVAEFPGESIKIFGNSIAPSVMVETASGRKYRAAL